MKIVQISDIHLSSYMSRTQVRRAVDMANVLGADLAVITGDLITGMGILLPIASKKLAVCMHRSAPGLQRQSRDLRARGRRSGLSLRPGRHEAPAPRERTNHFQRRAVQSHRRRLPTRAHLPRPAPANSRRRRAARPPRHANILLSHNPNSFNRAAELGIELSLAGHTHGGQIQVEILDHRLSPARFITDYIAGLYQRPLFAAAVNERASATGDKPPVTTHSSSMAHIYVNAASAPSALPSASAFLRKSLCSSFAAPSRPLNRWRL